MHILSLSFEVVGHGSRARRDQPNTTHLQYVIYLVNKQNKEEVECVGLKRNLEHSLLLWVYIILLKYGSRNVFKEGKNFVAAQIVHDTKLHLRAYAQTTTMMFDNALWKAVFTGIASNTNVVIMVPQIKAGSVRKDNLLPISR
ncbi:hypothetical protein TNCV_1056791 [Trichonephila clavipes]|nr:hypothetical protein TNCV_1056791 [Trichonephila clavipes]